MDDGRAAKAGGFEQTHPKTAWDLQACPSKMEQQRHQISNTLNYNWFKAAEKQQIRIATETHFEHL